eukprot:TRINITY_DN1142_c0_g1_i12.p1 TRINITY_DN1142_c0_g1~~TRINITY_DN1142_c0_g1_i12.p1  ORF type:complete len:387 (+),score=58.36 TRINITY_DN1142_c0_g1_i12:169-1329(+)
MEYQSYKKQHEEYLSNNTGSSFIQVYLLLLLAPASVFFHRSLANQIQHSSQWIRFLFDFTVITFPLLICFCFPMLTLWIISFLVLFPFAINSFLKRRGETTKQKSVWGLESLQGKRKSFVDEYRGSMLVSTFIAILLVDFTIFPKYLAKTETYGTSLMDVGVGSFLFASSLTSKQTLAVNSRLKTIQKTLSSTSPLLIVGFIRLLGVKATDYQEHVSEYGVHWNFFFTLASVSILFSLLQIVKHEINIVLGIFMLIAYQFSLSKFGLSSYLQNNDRSNLLNQNKEGIFSLFGYTALFLFGREIGRAIFSNKERDLANWKWMSVKMGLGSCITLLLGLLSHYYIEQTSRRMVNMAYVLTTLSMNLLLLSCLLLISICTPSTGEQPPF